MSDISPEVDAEAVLQWALMKQLDAGMCPYFPDSDDKREGYMQALEEIISLIQTGKAGDEL